MPTPKPWIRKVKTSRGHLLISKRTILETWTATDMDETLLILKINTTFEDVQMMLKLFFDFSTGFRFSKISVECSVHICSCP